MSETPRHWSGEVTESDRHDVGGGVFADGSAQEIADAVIAAARAEGESDVERSAMAKLTFYENRAGSKLSDDRRATLDDAKAIVRESLSG